MTLANIKKQIFDDLSTYIKEKTEKIIIDSLILFGGEVKTSSLLKNKADTTWLKNMYFCFFGFEINKNKIYSWISKNVDKFNFLKNENIENIKIYLYVTKKKITYIEDDFVTNNMFWKPNVSNNNFLSHSNQNNDISIEIIKFLINESTNEEVTKIILNKTIEKFNCEETLIKKLIKSTKLKYISDAKIKERELRSKKEIQRQILKNNKFIKYKKKYWVSKKGEIFKETKEGFKKVKISYRSNNNEYKYIQVFIDSSPVHLHKLMAKLFIPNPNNYKYVRAIDGNAMNVNINNLEWIEYPAISRIIKSISKNDETWLNFIINNFISGITITNLSKILAKKADKFKLFQNNNNKEGTIFMTIKKYSQQNKSFPIFNIRKDLNNSVFISNTNNKKDHND